MASGMLGTSRFLTRTAKDSRPRRPTLLKRSEHAHFGLDEEIRFDFNQIFLHRPLIDLAYRTANGMSDFPSRNWSQLVGLSGSLSLN